MTEIVANILFYEAKELKDTQTFGRQSPYATVATSSAPGNIQRSVTYTSGGDIAVWNEIKRIPMDPTKDTLLISVKNENKNVTIGQTRLPCSALTDVPTYSWYVLSDSKGLFAGNIRIGLSLSVEPANPVKRWQGQQTIGGFSEPARQGIPQKIGGFAQPAYQAKGGHTIGGFSQPAQSATHTIGGFQQPSTGTPQHPIGGFSTVTGPTTGGSTQTVNAHTGLATTVTTPANSGGNLGGYGLPNSTVRGPYVPQTDTAHGGRPLYSPVLARPAPAESNFVSAAAIEVVAQPVTYSSQAVGAAHNGLYSANPVSVGTASASTAHFMPPAPPLATHLSSHSSSSSVSSGGSTTQRPLPEGWEVKSAPDGRMYYIDHNTQTTSWTAPV